MQVRVDFEEFDVPSHAEVLQPHVVRGQFRIAGCVPGASLLGFLIHEAACLGVYDRGMVNAHVPTRHPWGTGIAPADTAYHQGSF